MGYLGRVRPKSRWWAVVGASLIGAVMAVGGSAFAEPPPPPTTVSLTSNASSVTVPAEIKLTATTDQSMTDTGYGVVIIDISDGGNQMVGCGNGTMCVAAADYPGRGWYDKLPQCPTPRPAGQQCDEFPFFATKQGGEHSIPQPHVKLIAERDNMSQGGLYGTFTRRCLGKVDNAPFLNAPAPKGSGIPTLMLCN